LIAYELSRKDRPYPTVSNLTLSILDIEDGRTYTQEEMERRMEKWLER